LTIKFTCRTFLRGLRRKRLRPRGPARAARLSPVRSPRVASENPPSEILCRLPAHRPVSRQPTGGILALINFYSTLSPAPLLATLPLRLTSLRSVDLPDLFSCQTSSVRRIGRRPRAAAIRIAELPNCGTAEAIRRFRSSAIPQ